MADMKKVYDDLIIINLYEGNYFFFRLNAYAINKPEEPRAYKSLYASSGAQPDFHALQYFLPYDGR